MDPIVRWELLVRKKMEHVPQKISWLMNDPRNIYTNYLTL